MNTLTPEYHQYSFWENSDIIHEVKFKASLSGGKGGQHVNKTSTKVELYWSPEKSCFLTEDMKTIIKNKLAKKLNTEGELRLISEESRSQLKNKETVIDKFYTLLAACFKVKRPRKPTKIPKSVIAKRLDNKNKRKQIKQNRKKI